MQGKAAPELKLPMRVVEDYNLVPAFELVPAKGPRTPFVFNAPHSGDVYTRDFIASTRLDRQTIRRSEDTFVDGLFARVGELGAPLLKANFPRAYVDLNRAANELDPDMFSGQLDMPVALESPRVAGGLGVIARVVGDRQEIYEKRLPPAEAARRLEQLYRPYHRTLTALIQETVDAFGTCVLVDCHSMPSGAVKAAGGGADGRCDIILGDRFGTSCASALAESCARHMRRHGLIPGLNRPYAGGFITEHYGRPPIVHALQIEINRALYMDEAHYRPNASFGQMQDTLTAVAAALIDDFSALCPGDRWPLAAE